MTFTKQHILEALSTIVDPSTKRDLVALGLVKNATADDDHIALTLLAPPGGAEACHALRKVCIEAIEDRAKDLGAIIHAFDIQFVDDSGAQIEAAKINDAQSTAQSPPPQKSQANASKLPGVKRIVAVGSGKGGVGKSTVSLNLAVGLARQGLAVGLLDGDIYGPSLPTLLGLDSLKVSMSEHNMLDPFIVHGIRAMTIGKLVDPEKPLIWRGPMAHGAFTQLTKQTQWGELDYLIIDLPPGTGDISLTMSQLVSLDGAVIVCTPQKVAQDDAIRAVRMFQQLGIEIAGVVENMSHFVADDGKEYDIFGRGGAERMAQRYGLPYLGALPIHMELRANSDAGNPTANFEGNASLRQELETLADQFQKQVDIVSMRKAQRTPTLSVT